MSRVTGLDLSLTGTGVAVYGEFGWDTVTTIKTKAPTSVPLTLTKGRAQVDADVHRRLDLILDGITGHCLGSDLVVVEGPSYASKGAAVHQIAGLWWLVRHRLHHLDIETVVVTPSQVKKFATGKGSAIDKDRMVIEVVKRWPEAEVANNNEADAVVLAAIGRHLRGEPITDLPLTHLEVIPKIEESHRAAA